MYLKQSTAAVIPFGPFVDKTDGVTLETGLVTALDHASTGILLSKNGGTLTIRHATVTATTYDAHGCYKVTLDTTDTGTLGSLRVIYSDATTCLPVWQDFQVVTANVYDSLFSTDVLDVSVTQILGTAVSTPATAGILDVNVKNINNTAAATPGAAGGLFIAGANAATSITTALTANVTGNITGNLTGSVGSVTGAVGSVTGAVGSVTGAVGSVTGNVGGNVTGSVGSVASYGTLVADIATAVWGATTRTLSALSTTLAASVWNVLASAVATPDSIGLQLKTNVDAAITTRSTYAGGAVASVTGAVGSVAGNVVGSVGSLATQAKADVNAEVVDALATDTYAESSGVPGATSTLAARIVWMGTLARNKITQTATTQTLRNDADNGDVATSAVSDNGSVFTRSEWT